MGNIVRAAAGPSWLASTQKLFLNSAPKVFMVLVSTDSWIVLYLTDHIVMDPRVMQVV